MAASVPPTRTTSNMGARASNPKESRRWLEGKSDPIARLVAPVLGLKPVSAGHLMRHIGVRCAAIVRAFVQLGDQERLEKFIRPILTAYESREAPPLCDATFNLAQEADAAEDVAETAFNRDQSDANLDRLIRASEREVQREESRLLALYAERDRRRRMAT